MLLDWFNQVMGAQPLIQLLDIIIVWYLIYKLLMYARGTQMMNLLKGIAVFIAAKFLSSILGLQTIDWLLGQVLAWGVVAAIILFQPELRRALQNLGQNLFRNKRVEKNLSMKLIDDLVYAARYMSRRKIGALISVKDQDELGEYIETGIPLDSEISNQLLINIFIPNTPLHDGAVIVSDYRIAAASCYLPLSESDSISKELGTRHRAAIGLSEVSDALTLIVSEETGSISITKNEVLYRDLKEDELTDLLIKFLYVEEEQTTNKSLIEPVKGFFFDTFKQRGEDE